MIKLLGVVRRLALAGWCERCSSLGRLKPFYIKCFRIDSKLVNIEIGLSWHLLSPREATCVSRNVRRSTPISFDQKEILEQALKYVESQLAISGIDVIKIDSDEGTDAPEKFKETVTPGKPSLWLR